MSQLSLFFSGINGTATSDDVYVFPSRQTLATDSGFLQINKNTQTAQLVSSAVPSSAKLNVVLGNNIQLNNNAGSIQDLLVGTNILSSNTTGDVSNNTILGTIIMNSYNSANPVQNNVVIGDNVCNFIVDTPFNQNTLVGSNNVTYTENHNPIVVSNTIVGYKNCGTTTNTNYTSSVIVGTNNLDYASPNTYIAELQNNIIVGNDNKLGIGNGAGNISSNNNIIIGNSNFNSEFNSLQITNSTVVGSLTNTSTTLDNIIAIGSTGDYNSTIAVSNTCQVGNQGILTWNMRGDCLISYNLQAGVDDEADLLYNKIDKNATLGSVYSVSRNTGGQNALVTMSRSQLFSSYSTNAAAWPTIVVGGNEGVADTTFTLYCLQTGSTQITQQGGNNYGGSKIDIYISPTVNYSLPANTAQGTIMTQSSITNFNPSLSNILFPAGAIRHQVLGTILTDSFSNNFTVSCRLKIDQSGAGQLFTFEFVSSAASPNAVTQIFTAGQLYYVGSFVNSLPSLPV